MYVVDSSARKATITLTGEEVAVKFPCTYSVFGIKGDSMLLYPKSGMAQGDDGVYDTAEGDGSVIMCLHYQADTVYIKGTGDCVIWAGNSTLDNPFKATGKGGGGSGGDNTHYKGTTTTAIENGSTTNPITIGGEEYTAVFGDIVMYGYTEFVFDGTTWSEFGRPFDTTPTSGSANAVTSDGVYSLIHKGIGTNSAVILPTSTASGQYSVAIGHGLVSNQKYQVNVGRFNFSKQGDIFEIGNGLANNSRSNIVEVTNTEMNVNGDIKRDGVGIDDYTTTERKIGKWIDGSDLYQRTFEVTGLHNDGTYDDNILGTSGSGIVIREWTGYLQYDIGTGKQHFPIYGYWSSATDWVGSWTTAGCDDLSIHAKLGTSTYTIDKAIITIKYTKPSEQANALNANIQQTEEPTDEMR